LLLSHLQPPQHLLLSLVCRPFRLQEEKAHHSATFLAIILAIGALLSPSSAGVQIILTLIFPPMFYTFFTKALAAYENIPLTPDYIRTSPQGDAPVIALLVVAIVRHSEYGIN
jgi:hypothetical protein